MNSPAASGSPAPGSDAGSCPPTFPVSSAGAANSPSWPTCLTARGSSRSPGPAASARPASRCAPPPTRTAPTAAASSSCPASPTPSCSPTPSRCASACSARGARPAALDAVLERAARQEAAADPRHLRAPGRRLRASSPRRCCGRRARSGSWRRAGSRCTCQARRCSGSARCPCQAPTPASPAITEAGDAVELFAQRAAAAVSGFTLTAADLPHAIRLCRRLDGIPLAIELAAVRVRALPVAELAARIEAGLAAGTGTRRGATSRHQTLHAAIDWSYGLCTAAEKAAWRRLSVFAGTFDLAVARDVIAASGRRARTCGPSRQTR